jgi:hypothetical protein
MNSDQVLCLSPVQAIGLRFQLFIYEEEMTVRKIIGVDKKAKVAPLYHFDAKGNYKLSKYLEEAFKAANLINLRKILLKQIKG